MCQLLTHDTDRCILLQVDGICDKNVVFPFLIEDTHGAFEAFARYQGVGCVESESDTPFFGCWSWAARGSGPIQCQGSGHFLSIN